ncbi:MAG: hypothetical protein IJ325_08760 [Clostridia bacterium]|nr:hypothetical protein [Clostridia bacterium]
MGEIFPALVGNKYIKETLGTDIRSGQASHAYIFSGPVGSGKHTAARLCCAASVCEHRTETGYTLPCTECASCRKILRDISADVTFVNSGSRATIGVEQIRTIRQNLYITPNDGERKFYIIEEAEKMTPQAQNALLLSLEEPPPFVTFFLLTTDAAALLETIRSRAPVLSMELFYPERVMEWLRTQKGGTDAEKRDSEYFRSAAVLSGGALGRAKTLLFSESDASELMLQRTFAMTVLSGIFTGKTSDFLVKIQAELPKSRETAAAAMIHVQTALRDLIVRKKNAQVPMLFFTGSEDILPHAGRYALSRLTALYRLTEQTCARIQANGSLHASLAEFAMEARQI